MVTVVLSSVVAIGFIKVAVTTEAISAAAADVPFVPLVHPVNVKELIPVYVIISLPTFIAPATGKPSTLTKSIDVSLSSNASPNVVALLEISLKGVISYSALLL
jgi:hypothetical protein